MTTIDSTDTARAVDAMTPEELLKSLEGLAPPEERKVYVNFVPAHALTRYPCALGGSTDKEPILCEVTEGPYVGFRVSPLFLKTCTDLDAELEREAIELDGRAASILEKAKGLRALKGGRLVLPTYQEFRDAWAAEENQYVEAA